MTVYTPGDYIAVRNAMGPGLVKRVFQSEIAISGRILYTNPEGDDTNYTYNTSSANVSLWSERTDFDSGDLISVAGDRRVFLARKGDLVYYFLSEDGEDAYFSNSGDVTPWENPYPFEVGDRITPYTGGLTYTVMHLDDKARTVYLAFYDTGSWVTNGNRVKQAQADYDGASGWEKVE